MKLKHELPEIGDNQYPIFERIVAYIIGSDVDVQSLVQAGQRQLAKEGGAVNADHKEQFKRAREVMGQPEPAKPDNRWWLNG